MTASLAIFAAFMGPTELMLVLGILILLFGATKLPSLARGLGQSMKEFKKAQKEDDEVETPIEKKAEPTKTHGGTN